VDPIRAPKGTFDDGITLINLRYQLR